MYRLPNQDDRKYSRCSIHFRPWRTLPRPRKLRIGILRDDGVVRPVTPITRALDTIGARLQGNPAFEVVEYEPYKSAEAWDIIVSLMGI